MRIWGSVLDRARRVARLMKYLGRDVLPIWLVRTATDWLPEFEYVQRLRGALHRPFFGRCGRGLRMGQRVILLRPSQMSLGNDVLVGTGCWLEGTGGLEIEDEVLLAPYCVLSSTKHTFVDGSASRGPLARAATRVGRGSWLAAHVVVSAGVSIGRGVTVAANAAVVKDIPDDVLAAGVPARVLKTGNSGAREAIRTEPTP